jgi:hypothetical protein
MYIYIIIFVEIQYYIGQIVLARPSVSHFGLAAVPFGEASSFVSGIQRMYFEIYLLTHVT